MYFISVLLFYIDQCTMYNYIVSITINIIYITHVMSMFSVYIITNDIINRL